MERTPKEEEITEVAVRFDCFPVVILSGTNRFACESVCAVEGPLPQYKIQQFFPAVARIPEELRTFSGAGVLRLRGKFAKRTPPPLRMTNNYLNNSPLNSARFRRQTIHTCPPGVSMPVLWTPLESSQARTFRFASDQTVIRSA